MNRPEQLKPRSVAKKHHCHLTAVQWLLGKSVGFLSTFSSGQALNLKFTDTVCNAQLKGKLLSQQGDSDFLNTFFFFKSNLRHHRKTSKQKEIGTAEYENIYSI